MEHAAVILEKDGLPDDFSFDHTTFLKRTVLDLGRFGKPRELPLLYDIVSALPTGPNDIVVQTNVDIAVVPHFYLLLEELFRNGTDCVVINRRTISETYTLDDDVYLMSSEVGEEHPGFDCFAFRADLLSSFEPFDSCVGIGGVARPLLYNLLAFAEMPAVLLDAHATFHLGNDKSWKSKDFDDYYDFNTAEMDRVVEVLLAQPETGQKLVRRCLSSTSQNLITPAMRASFGLPVQDKSGQPGPARRVLRRLGSYLSEV